MLQVEILRDAGKLRALSNEWSGLADATGSITPFQLPPWQLTWWQHFGSRDLRCYTFREADQLVGLVPLFRHLWQGRWQLTLIGSGLSDYLDPLLLRHDVLPVLSQALQAEADWDICDWQDLRQDTPLQSLPDFQIEVQPDVPCSAIPLVESFSSYWSQRSADLRRNIKRYARKAQDQGGPMHFLVEPPNTALMDILIDLHSRRWQHEGESGMVELNRSGDFLRDVFTRDPTCQTFRVVWNEEVVAMTAGFVREGTVYSYLSAFDPRYEILGFGRYLLYRSLQWAFEQQICSWNFLRGEESYKASFGAVATPKCRLRITRS